MAVAALLQEKAGVQQDLLNQAGPTTPVEARHVMPAPGGQSYQVGGMKESNEHFIGTCPDCSSQLEVAEGCVKCHVCGFSECG